MAAYASHIETSNEIETTHDPVDLLLRVFDDRFHMTGRFEAKCKLVLMDLAESIGQRERKRIFDSGVAEFLFPRDIYNLDMEQIRQALLERFRRHIQDSGRLHENIG